MSDRRSHRAAAVLFEAWEDLIDPRRWHGRDVSFLKEEVSVSTMRRIVARWSIPVEGHHTRCNLARAIAAHRLPEGEG